MPDKDESVSSGRFPNLAELARSATYYPNASTNADMTFRSVPGMLSGLALSEAGDPKQNLYRMFPSEETIRYEGMAMLTDLCVDCPSPPVEAGSLYGVPIKGSDMQAGTIRSTIGAIRAIKKSDPLLWTSHLIAPHAPYRFLASGHQIPLTKSLQNPGLSPEKAWGSQPWPPQLARQRFLGQAGMVDRIIGYLAAELKKADLFDQAMIIVLADHGASFQTGTYRRNIEAANFTEIASIPLVIKYPGQTSPQVDTGSAQLRDILPTISAVTGRQADWQTEGLDLRAPRPEREVRVFRAAQQDWIERSFSWFTESRRQHTSTWNQPELWSADKRDLEGQKVSSLNPLKPRAWASVELLDRFKKVRPSSGWIPAMLGGELHRLSPGRVIYAAVNGQIVSSGYSFQEDGQVRTAILLPESSIRPGRNHIQLLQESGGRLRLIKLRSAQ